MVLDLMLAPNLAGKTDYQSANGACVLEELFVEGFDPEQIWQQLMLEVRVTIHLCLLRFNTNPIPTRTGCPFSILFSRRPLSWRHCLIDCRVTTRPDVVC